jgi:plasmid stability protein
VLFRRCNVANLTLKIDDDVLRRARIRALEDGTSVNEFVRRCLATYAVTRDERTAAVRRVLEVAERERSGSGRGGRKWKRQDLYER